MSYRMVISPFERLRSWFPRVAFLLFIGLIALFLFRHRKELESLRHLQLVQPWWLLLTILAQGVVPACIAAQLQLLLTHLERRLPLRTLVTADLHRVAVSSVVPAGAAVGALVFARQLETQGIRREASLTAIVLYGALGVISFFALTPLTVFFVTQEEAIPIALRSTVVLLVGTALVAVLLLGGALVLSRRIRASVTRWSKVNSFLSVSKTVPRRPLVALFLLAISVDLLNVLILGGALRALGYFVSWDKVLIAYQLGYFFAFVVPVAQGTGAVELAGSAILHQLGLPGSVSVAAILLWRAHEFWAPLLAGTALWLQREPLVRRAVDRFPALLLFGSGMISIFGLLEPHHHRVFARGLERAVLFEPWELSRLTELVLGYSSLLVAQQVWRLKRTGWFLAVLLSGITIVQQALERRDLLVLVLSGLAFSVLVVRWRAYRVRSDVPSIVRGVGFAALSILVVVAYGTTGLVLLSRHALSPPVHSWWEAIHILVLSGFGLGTWPLSAETRYGAWFLSSVGVLAAVALLSAVWSLGRPVVWRYWVHPTERTRARVLIERCGNSSLDFFKSWPDKVFFFSRAGDGVVSYRALNGVALVLGDPNACGEEAFHRLLRDFLDFCELNDWEPAFHQVGTQFLPQYAGYGLRMLKLGEEAVVDLSEWSLERPGFKELRYRVRRLQREGYRFEVRQPPQDDTLLRELEEVNREWLTVPGRRERYFTLGQFSVAYLRSTPVAMLRDSAGKVVAFTNLIPSGVDGEITIDLMRRRLEPHGAMEVLLASVLEYCREAGYQRFSLGLAPLVGVELPVPGIDPVRERFSRALDHLFSFRGLYHFKAKFGPRWEPRYLVYRSVTALPAVFLAIVEATEGRSSRTRATAVLEDPHSDWFLLPQNG
ncbi:phosphatidylglycerol lysyltransferase domain-containing protein [Thermomicrobium sp. CFH 73360]|uniref:phosphatidylglycerol lysyltransferase domain-containing protein n=1 Tax=Thermomicrobium sp. CFH 73360 TaxID=2951987 RepID=UPI00207753EB|nr:phosphatidylglycerol lysyltransferase domain-containing protein [Thermomicrobium sp. CFH 73360]MCM8747492.1 phosphatidylglycerol lysyltransferase domain-containing protein [Thermomicrobium sp. CFH 73360]